MVNGELPLIPIVSSIDGAVGESGGFITIRYRLAPPRFPELAIAGGLQSCSGNSPPSCGPAGPGRRRAGDR